MREPVGGMACGVRWVGEAPPETGPGLRCASSGLRGLRGALLGLALLWLPPASAGEPGLGADLGGVLAHARMHHPGFAADTLGFIQDYQSWNGTAFATIRQDLAIGPSESLE